MEAKTISLEEFKKNSRDSNFSAWKPSIIEELIEVSKKEGICLRYEVAKLKTFYIGDNKKPIHRVARRFIKDLFKKSGKVANADSIKGKTLDDGSKVIDIQVISRKK